MELNRMDRDDFRTRRIAMGFSQSELADELGVGRDTIKRWESGKESVPYRVPAELDEIAAQRIINIATTASATAPETRTLYGDQLTTSMSVKAGDGYAPIVGIAQTFRDASRLVLDGWDVTVMAGGEAHVIHLDKDDRIEAALQSGSFPSDKTITQVIETAREVGMLPS